MSLPVPTKARVLILPSFEGTAGSRSYTSTNPTPVVLSFPLMIPVYAPDSKFAHIADSRSLIGGRVGMQGPAAKHAQVPSLQLSLMIVVKPAGPCSSSTGSANGS